jgi:D-sedoheptulose 7-phosphate isomerase
VSTPRRLAYIRQYKRRIMAAIEAIRESDVERLIDALARARDEGRRIFLCGNGGSASTASHMSVDLGKGAARGEGRRFRVVSLSESVAWITALANDLDYADIFVEQLKALAEPADVLVAFSGSGNSPNVVKAVEWANASGLHTIGITGRPGGRLGRCAQLPLFIDSTHMGHIEEGHFVLQHLVSYFFVEAEEPRPADSIAPRRPPDA